MTETTPDSQLAEASLAGLLGDLQRLAQDSERVTIRALMKTLGARGHGPIVLTLAAFLMLPTGAIPFMPAILSALLILTACEMIIGRRNVSLPPFIGRREIGTRLLQSALVTVDPMCRRLARILHPRWSILVQSSVSIIAIALILIVAAAIMIVIGSIPGLPFVICIPILFFGLGLTAGDGLVVAIGFLTTALAAAGVIYLVPQILSWWAG